MEETRIEAVYVAMYKPEEKRWPEVVGVCTEPSMAAECALRYMRTDKSWSWKDDGGSQITEEHVISWEGVPGDQEEWEFTNGKGEVVLLQVHPLEHPVPKENEDDTITLDEACPECGAAPGVLCYPKCPGPNESR